MENIERCLLILERISEQIASGDIDADCFMNDLDYMLNQIHCMDGFGTEGQCDPRGDFRNGNWTMERLEGIDE